MKTLLTTAACIAALATPALAGQWPEQDAMNHGYMTAAYEVVCGDMLTVSNPKLRAKFDRLYRNPGSKWRDAYLQGYEGATAGPRPSPAGLWMTCTLASDGDDRWLTLKPAARDRLTVEMRRYEAERR